MTLSEIGEYAIAHLAQKALRDEAYSNRTKLKRIFARKHGYEYKCNVPGPDQDEEINYAHGLYVEERTKTEGTRRRLSIAVELYLAEKPKS